MTVSVAEREYYYRPGMELRPIPETKDSFPKNWLPCREFLLGDWLDITPEVEPTEETRLFDDHLWQGDELMDAVVDMFIREGADKGRAMFNQALTQGIEIVDDPPKELRALFDKVSKLPDWYDPEAAHRGQRRLAIASMGSVIGTTGLGIFETVLNADVSAATGATGRFRYAGPQRFIESMHYFKEVMTSPAAGPGTSCYEVTLRVRLMHAQARRGLRAKWGDEYFLRNGNPISNSSMCGFNELLLGMVLVDHRLGRRISREELDDCWHYISYWAWMAGVADEMVPRDSLGALRNLNYLLARAGEPSQWRAQLVDSLLAWGSNDSGVSRAKRIAGKALATVFVSTAYTMLGPSMATEFAKGTEWEGINAERVGRAFLRIAKASAAFAAFRDRLPWITAIRRHAFGGLDVVTTLMEVAAPKKASSGQLVADYATHDRSVRGDTILHISQADAEDAERQKAALN